MYKRTGFEARIVFKRVSYFLKILVVVVKQVGVLQIHLKYHRKLIAYNSIIHCQLSFFVTKILSVFVSYCCFCCCYEGIECLAQ